jgi:hypothetical protein
MFPVRIDKRVHPNANNNITQLLGCYVWDLVSHEHSCPLLPRLIIYARGDHWAKIVEQRAIKNRVQYIHCR